MAIRSVLDVEVNDAAFQRYRELFEKYQAQVAKLPDAWQEIAGATKDATSEFQKIAAAVEKHAAATAAIVKAQSRSVTIGDRQTHQWHSLAESSKKMAANFEHIARSMLRIGTIGGAVGGLLGLGGLFGLDRLANNVSGWRRAAMGLGTTIGGQRAFGLDFGRVVDSGAFLSGVNAALHDVSKRSALFALGINPAANADTASVAAQTLGAVKTLVDQTPSALLGQVLQARQLGSLGLTLQDLERIKATPRGELAQYAAQFRQDRNTLNLPRRVAKEWQDLSLQMQRAGGTIERTFVMGLSPLAPELAKLSDGFTKLVQSALSNPHLKEWIDDVAQGMDRFAKYLHSDRLGRDVSNFMDELERLARGVDAAVQWFDRFNVRGAEAGAVVGGVVGATVGMPVVGAAVGGAVGSQLRAPTPFEMKHGIPGWRLETTGPGETWYKPWTWKWKWDPRGIIQEWQKTAQTLSPMQAQAIADAEARKKGVPIWFERKIFAKEGGLNPNGTARISPAGAIGFGQLMPRTAMGLHVNPFDTAQNARGSVDLMEQIHQAHPGWTWQQVAAAYNSNPSTVARAIARYGADWKKGLKPETQGYVKGFGGTIHQYAGTAPAAPSAAAPPSRDGEYQRALTTAINRLRESQQRGANVKVNISNATGANVAVSAAMAAQGY